MFNCDTCFTPIWKETMYVCQDCGRRVCEKHIYIDVNGEHWCVEGSDFGLEMPFDEELFFWWVLNLYDSNKMFHFDDPPQEIVDIKTGERVFTDSEVKEIYVWLDAAFSYLEDPFEVALDAQRMYEQMSLEERRNK